MRTIAFAVLVILSTALNAATSKGVWEQYPKLICQSEKMVFCDPANVCLPAQPSAVFVIDFPAGTVKAAVSPKPSRILSKTHLELVGCDSVETERGEFCFAPAVDQPFGTPLIKAVTTIASFPSSAVMWLGCHPL